jgi:predicted ATPase
VSLPELEDRTRYPFDVRAFSHGIDLPFRTNVTLFVGENGSGKSTLLEAIAECCGFNPEGGNRDHQRATFAERSPLAKALRLSWRPRVTEGFFLRAESGLSAGVSLRKGVPTWRGNERTSAPAPTAVTLRCGGA